MMINKIKHDKITLCLFFISFLMTFIIAYFGMNNYRQFEEVKNERKANYYLHYLEVYGTKKNNEIPECPVNNGNVFVTEAPNCGNEVFNTISLDILWKKNEEISETFDKESYYSDIKETYVLIGKGMEKSVYQKGDKKYVKIDHHEVLVAGVLAPITFNEEDDRCIMIPKSLEDAKRFLISDLFVEYNGNGIDESQKAYEWAEKFIEINTDDILTQNGMLFDDNFDFYQKILDVVIKIIIIFCLVNASFLAYFWGKRELYSFMVKRTIGFSRDKIFIELLLQFLAIEGLVFLIFLVGAYIYELIMGHPEIWLKNIQFGFGILIIVFLMLGFVISMFPMIWIVKANPIDVLRNKE